MTGKGIRVIVLGAGKSERFGTAKLLAEFRGKPLLHHSLLAAQGACPGDVCLVVGHKSDEIANSAQGLADIVVANEDYANGIGSSIACGIRACGKQADAVVVMLADQPLVSFSHLSELMQTWTGDPDEIVASGFSGVSGPPVLFASGLFSQLGQLSGDVGARKILDDNAQAVRTVDFEAASVDIDTPEDLQALVDRHQS